MNADNRKDALKTRHAELEERIHQEMNHPHPDEALVADLKKQKLKIKDEIAEV